VTPHPMAIFIESIRNVFFYNSKLQGDWETGLASGGGAWYFLCRTHPRRKEVNKSKSKPLRARAPAFLCVNMANPAIPRYRYKNLE
jgi:hypothetical protein